VAEKKSSGGRREKNRIELNRPELRKGKATAAWGNSFTIQAAKGMAETTGVHIRREDEAMRIPFH